MNIIDIKNAAAFLLGCDGYLIYPHASPDGDALGSATGLALILKSLGKKVSVFSVDGIPQRLNFLPTEGLYLEKEPENFENYTLVSVDVAGPRMLLGAKNTHFALSIDHHKVNSIECDNLLVMADRIACGEIIFKLMEEMGAKLTKDIAICLYTAICSDSGGFKYDAVKPETHIMAAKCIETGIDFSEINRRLFECKTPSQVALTKAAYRNLELLRDGKCAIVAIPQKEVEECGGKESDFDCINSIPREIDGVCVSAVIRKKSDGIKISMRSNNNTDVAEIAKSNGGGGHYHAAGFTFNGSFEEAVSLVRKIFSELDI